MLYIQRGVSLVWCVVAPIRFADNQHATRIVQRNTHQFNRAEQPTADPCRAETAYDVELMKGNRVVSRIAFDPWDFVPYGQFQSARACRLDEHMTDVYAHTNDAVVQRPLTQRLAFATRQIQQTGAF